MIYFRKSESEAISAPTEFTSSKLLGKSTFYNFRLRRLIFLYLKIYFVEKDLTKMVRCDYCGKEIKGLSFKCHRCTGEYCSNHHLPEDHNCPGLKKEKEKNQEKWKKAFVKTFANKKYMERRPKPSKLRKKKSLPKEKKEYISFPTRKRKLFTKLKYFLIYKTEDILDWLKSREHHKYNFERRFNYLLGIIIPLIISIVAYTIFYANAQKLNDVSLWIIKLGGVLILTSIFFIIKYGIRLIKELINILKRQRNWLKYLIIILLLFLLWQAYTNKETILNPVFNIYNETNFSLFVPIGLGNFSLNFDSKDVSEINFIEDIFFDAPERKKECMETFERLNEIRKSYGKNTISWDNRAYELAVARSKDMYEKDYMDHTSPTGECPENMKKDYGFNSNEYLAENAGGMSYYSKGSVAGDCDEALDSWLSSRGHRYNLLYGNHKSGAIGCYYELCVFLGVHNDFYGLGGGGECYYASEGEAYWNTAGIQPGEV